MSLFKQWNDMLSGKEGQTKEFWNTYLALETNIYKEILGNQQKTVHSTVKAFAEEHHLSPVLAVGFLDGINESLVSSLALEEFEDDTEFTIKIDFKELYKNMLKVKAKWLSGLEEWDALLSKEERRAIKSDYVKSVTAVSEKIGRNDPCTCGSGKKYKKCCGA